MPLGGHGDSRASGFASGVWFLMSIQEQEAGRGEVDTSLGEMFLRQRQVDD